MDINHYPNYYLTEFKDHNAFIVLQPNHPRYDTKATYYLRARPDFALYDLISERQYIFNFYAIGQLPSHEWNDI